MTFTRTAHPLRLLLFTCCALLLAACNIAINSGSPDVTPAPSPTAPDIPLTAAYSGEDIFDGTLRFDYPQGWVVRGGLRQANGLMLFSTTSLADTFAERETIPSRQVGLLVLVLPEEVLQRQGAGSTGVTAALTSFLDNLQASGSEVGFGEIATVQYADGQTIGRTAAVGGDVDDALLLAKQDGAAYILFSASTASGELPSFEPILLAMLGSAEYSVDDASG